MEKKKLANRFKLLIGFCCVALGIASGMLFDSILPKRVFQGIAFFIVLLLTLDAVLSRLKVADRRQKIILILFSIFSVVFGVVMYYILK